MNLARLRAEMLALYDVLQDADVEPTSQVAAAATELGTALERSLAAWQNIRTKDIPALNTRLRQAGLAEIVIK
jgi:hypothetical protein